MARINPEREIQVIDRVAHHLATDMLEALSPFAQTTIGEADRVAFKLRLVHGLYRVIGETLTALARDAENDRASVIAQLNESHPLQIEIACIDEIRDRGYTRQLSNAEEAWAKDPRNQRA